MSIALQRKSGEALSQTVRIRQHLLLSDVSVLEGGTDEGPSPHDLYDAALGSCKALTVLWYARKKGIPVKDIQTEVISDNSEERKGTYRLSTRLKISGDLTDAQLAELTSVAEKCPVHKLMTTVATEITTSVERVA